MVNATERRALMLTTFTAACICFAPAEIISAVLLLIASGLLYRWDQKLRRQEAETPPHPQATPAPAAPSE
jgi:hypothetical protein